MIKTIRGKLFFIFISLIISTLLGGILINIFFLEDFYIYKNEKKFINIADKISSQYTENKKKIQEYISSIDKEEGIATYIIDENFNIKYYSVSQKNLEESSKVNKEIQNIILTTTKDYIYQKLEKENSETPKIVLVTNLQNGDKLILTKPLKGISESAEIANEFLLFTGIIIIVIGTLVIYIFANKITKPIVKMSKVAENISNLNFNEKVEVESKDEIGSLGDSINNISKKLSVSINSLEKDIEIRKELVRNMSHELKTPIAVVKGYAEGINYGVTSNEEMLHRYCNVIAEECDRMDSLVKEILEISKLEEISYDLNISEFTINTLMKDIENRFVQIMNQNNIKYNFIYDKKISIQGDYNLIERAITNFITNAIKYVNENRFIEVKVSNINNQVEFSVYNTGNKIDKDEINKIWNVFYKIDRARSRKEVGHGLGLAIVKRIVDLHDGEVGCENYKEGIKFFFKI